MAEGRIVAAEAVEDDDTKAVGISQPEKAGSQAKAQERITGSAQGDSEALQTCLVLHRMVPMINPVLDQ